MDKKSHLRSFGLGGRLKSTTLNHAPSINKVDSASGRHRVNGYFAERRF